MILMTISPLPPPLSVKYAKNGFTKTACVVVPLDVWKSDNISWKCNVCN